MTVVKSFLILIALLTLTACGGGGGSADSTDNHSSNGGNTPTPATLTLASTPTSVPLTENKTIALTFILEGVEGTLSASMDYDYLPENSTLETIIDGSTVTVSIDVGSELMHEASSNFTITIEDERSSANQSVSWSEQLTIVNTSGDSKHDRYIALKNAAQTYTSLLPEQKLVERLVALSALVNPDSTVNTRTSLANEIKEIIEDAEYATALSDALDVLDEYTSKYIAGEVNEDEMINIQGSLDNAIFNYSQAVHSVIQSAIAETAGEVTGYEYQGAIPNEKGEQLSSFIGNTSLGAYENDHWLFNGEYAFLESIIFSELETCSAE